VYLDWAATTPPDREILAEAMEVSLERYGNPSSVHEPGKKARTTLEDARIKAAAALSVKPETIFFTSGGTESNHLPMLSLLQRPVRGTIAISAVEHPSIVEQARMLELTGWKTLVIPVTPDGFVTPDAVISTIRDDTSFVAVMAVNNETGAIQPVREIASALLNRPSGKKKPHFHVDAVQAAGKIPLDLSAQGIDSASVSAHKLQGPRGIGLLYMSRKFEPFIRGGGQEAGIRPGTENLAGAVALSRCLEKSCTSAHHQGAQDTMAYLIGAIADIKLISIIPATRIPTDERFSPYILQCTNERIPGEVLVRSLSDRGVYLSTGSACSSKKKGRPVLQAMRIKPDAQQNAFRVSIGNATTTKDIDAFIAALIAVFSAL
jgi:cysteine desulfurase